MSAFSDLITGAISKEEFDDLVKKKPKKENKEDERDMEDKRTGIYDRSSTKASAGDA